MAAYVPPGWPAGVHPPDSEEFVPTAVTWLLDVVPPDYRLHGVLRRHPLALAVLARHHLAACVQGAREGYRTARTELASLPPGGVDAVLEVYRGEGRRLVETARAVDLVGRALRGEVFTPQLGTRAQSAPRREAAGAAASGRDADRAARSADRQRPTASDKGAARTDTARTDTAQTDTAQTDTAQTDTARTDSARTDTAQTSTAQTSTAQTSTAQTSTAQTSTARTDTAPGDAPAKSASAKGGVAKNGAAKEGTAKNGAAKEGAAEKPRGTGRRGAKSGRPR